MALPDGLIQVAPDGGVTLLGGYSPTSGRTHFPLSPVCPYTGADDVEPRALSGRGTLFGWTAVTAAPPGYAGPVPYGFGIVALVEEGLRVVGRLTVSDPSLLHFGQPMRVVAETLPVAAEGEGGGGAGDAVGELVVWAFAPDEGWGGP